MSMTSSNPREIFNTWQDSGLPSSTHVIGKITSGSPSMFWGRVGPLLTIVNATVVLNAASPYAPADHTGSGGAAYGMIRFKNAARVAKGGGIVHGATFIDLGQQSPNFDLILFSAVAGTGHGKDNAAYNLADADAWKVLGTLSAGTKSAAVNPTKNWVSAGITNLQYIPAYMPFTCATGKDLYGEIVLGALAATWAAVSTSDLKIRLLVEQN